MVQMNGVIHYIVVLMEENLMNLMMKISLSVFRIRIFKVFAFYVKVFPILKCKVSLNQNIC